MAAKKKKKKNVMKNRDRPLALNRDNEPFTYARKIVYCEVLEKTGDHALARRRIGITRTTVNSHKRNDEEFKAMIYEAEEIFAASLLAVAYERGVLGKTKTLYYQGKPILDETGKQIKEKIYSDKMLELLLKRFYPGFGKQEIEVTKKTEHSVEGLDLTKLTVEQRKQFRKILKAASDDDRQKLRESND